MFKLFLYIFLRLLIVNFSGTQGPVSTLYVSITTDDADMANIDDFIDALHEPLHVFGITLVALYTAEDYAAWGLQQGDETLRLSFSSTPNGIVLAVERQEAHNFLPSPNLHSGFNHAAQHVIPIEDNIAEIEAFNTGIDLVTAFVLYSLQDCETASRYFAALDLHPPQADAADIADYTNEALLFYRGNCALITEDDDLAAELYDAALQNTSNAAILDLRQIAFNRAWLSVQAGGQTQDAAIMLMTKALQAAITHGQQRDHVIALADRARIHALSFNHDAALADLEAALELAPENAMLHVQWGETALLLYEWDQVLEAYNTAISFDANYAPAYYHRAVLYYTVLARELALADFQQYVQLAPSGRFAETSEAYIESIQRELETLRSP